MLINEGDIETHLEALLLRAKSDPGLWDRLKGTPVYWMCFGELVPRLTLGDILANPPADILRQRPYPVTTFPAALEETPWDARSIQPDLQLRSRGAFVAVEIKGAAGAFVGEGGPLQYARGLCLAPPEGTGGATLGVLAVAPRAFFQRAFVTRIWEQWQIEFRRLTSKVPTFRWGIVLSEDLPEQVS